MSRLHDMARDIIDKGTEAMPKSQHGLWILTDWLDASQYLLDTNDTSEFEWMLERNEAYDEFCEWCAADPKREDEDFTPFYESWKARKHLESMSADRRAVLEKEWVA